MDADPIYLAPQGYAVTWPVLGGFILFGLLIWAVAIWLLTRRPEDPELHGSLPPSALAKLRRDALTRRDRAHVMHARRVVKNHAAGSELHEMGAEGIFDGELAAFVACGIREKQRR